MSSERHHQMSGQSWFRRRRVEHDPSMVLRPYGERLEPSSILESDGPWLSYKLLRQALEVFEVPRRGMVISKSDTCWGVFVVATDEEGVSLARTVTGHRPEPFPVAFSSVASALNAIKALDAHGLFLEHVWPGPFSAVGEASGLEAKFVSSLVRAPGTLAVRVPLPWTFESMASSELGRPVITTALRDRSGAPLRSSTDAWHAVCDAMSMHCIEPTRVTFIAPADETFPFSTHATVAKLVPLPQLIDTVRPGAISQVRIDELVALTKTKISYLDPGGLDDIT